MRKGSRTPLQVRAWAHNGLLGRLMYAEQIVKSAITADTATLEAQEFAVRVYNDIYRLRQMLKKRRD